MNFSFQIILISLIVMINSVDKISSTKNSINLKENVKKNIESNIWYFALGSSLLVFATFASFLVYCKC